MKNALLSISFLIFTVAKLIAQPGTLDNTFNPNDIGFGIGGGANARIESSAIQPNGKIIIGGAFNYYNSSYHNRLVRINEDGSTDASFTADAIDAVTCIAIQPDGKIIIGGDFAVYAGVTVNRIARLNTDGSVDNTFDTGTGANHRVNDIKIQSDGKIILAGDFNSFNGAACNFIIRLNEDGSEDNTFDSGSSGSVIRSIAIQSNGKIIIGGAFIEHNGVARKYIARINADGSLDNTFDPGTGADYIVNSVVLQSDEKIIISGMFVSYNGTPRNRIARLNSDGTLDNSFDPGIGPNSAVLTSTIQSDGKIFIGGSFDSYDGTAQNHIALINTNGSLDNTFNIGSGTNDPIYSFSLQPDGKIIACGDFTTYKTSAVRHIVRINTDGSVDALFNQQTGANADIMSAEVQSDGKIIIGGYFTGYNGSIQNHIARLNAAGGLDNTFNTGTGLGANQYSWAITKIQPDGKIIVAGSFYTYNDVSRNGIARINSDGSLDNTFDPGTGANAAVHCILIQPDGKIIIAGNFTTYNNITRNRIARLNTDGTLDFSFNPGAGANLKILTIALQSDEKIIIGGLFTTFDGATRNNIARLYTDGGNDSSFDPGTGTNQEISVVSIQPDGKIIIGGSFSFYNTSSKNNIVRLNTNGTVDNTFDPGIGTDNKINTISIQGDEKIIIGGFFTTYNGIGRRCIARLESNGTLDNSFDPGLGAKSAINSSAIQSDGKIIIGGSFTSYDNTGKNRIARINGTIATEVQTENVFTKNISVYPNPTTGKLTINFGANNQNVGVEVRSAQGTVIQKIFSGITSFDVDGPTGIYFVTIRNSNNETVVVKVVKE